MVVAELLAKPEKFTRVSGGAGYGQTVTDKARGPHGGSAGAQGVCDVHREPPRDLGGAVGPLLARCPAATAGR